MNDRTLERYLNSCYTETRAIIRRKKINKDDSWFVYVLSLVNGKYYVGQTQNIFIALYQHNQRDGAMWTTTHPMQGILKIAYNCKKDDDLKHITYEMMREHRWNNVRSSKFNRVNITHAPSDFASYDFDSYDVEYDYFTPTQLNDVYNKFVHL